MYIQLNMVLYSINYSFVINCSFVMNNSSAINYSSLMNYTSLMNYRSVINYIFVMNYYSIINYSSVSNYSSLKHSFLIQYSSVIKYKVPYYDMNFEIIKNTSLEVKKRNTCISSFVCLQVTRLWILFLDNNKKTIFFCNKSKILLIDIFFK